MKAVIWTDVLQALIMIVGLLSATIQGTHFEFSIKQQLSLSGFIVLGGFRPVFEIASKGGRMKFNEYIFLKTNSLVYFFVFQLPY